jgi:hypothetical protein
MTKEQTGGRKFRNRCLVLNPSNEIVRHQKPNYQSVNENSKSTGNFIYNKFKKRPNPKKNKFGVLCKAHLDDFSKNFIKVQGRDL